MDGQNLTIEQFGAKIKQKYPAYASYADADIGQKMLAKYPQYQSMVQQAPAAPQDQYTGTLGTNPNDSLYGKLLDNSITRGIQTIFPGKAIGEAVGNSINGIRGLASGNNLQFQDAVNANDGKMALRVGADAANVGLTALAPGATADTALGRVGLNTALGAATGATGAVAQSGNISDAVGGAAVGAGTGVAVSGATEAISGLVNKLPQRIIQQVLPKLNEANSGYALENMKLGTTDKLINTAKSASLDTQNQIQAALNHPNYVNVAENGQAVLQDTLSKMPSSEYSSNQIVNIAKRLIPEKAALITKIEANQANLAEMNEVRSALDKVTSKRFGDTPMLSNIKQVGATLADSLRGFVKDAAPETIPMFEQNSKELNLLGALNSAQKSSKSLNIFQLLHHLGSAGGAVAGAVTGFQSGSTPGDKIKDALIGGVGGYALGKFVASPATRVGVAKALSAFAPVGNAANTIMKGVQAPVINAAAKSLTP